jgi:hypothetical protein
MRPTATVRTASAGYQATGTGLETAACIVSMVESSQSTDRKQNPIGDSGMAISPFWI